MDRSPVQSVDTRRAAVAIVHAAMSLSGQTAIAGIKQPGARKNIFSFVVHKVSDRWMCASAQNTDVVPNMETNVVDDDGTFRAANDRNAVQTDET